MVGTPPWGKNDETPPAAPFIMLYSWLFQPHFSFRWSWMKVTRQPVSFLIFSKISITSSCSRRTVRNSPAIARQRMEAEATPLIHVRELTQREFTHGLPIFYVRNDSANLPCMGQFHFCHLMGQRLIHRSQWVHSAQ
jgi:hypothetical protein